MIEKGRRIITLPRTGVAGEAMTRSSNERYWQSTRIPCHGSQAINFASLEARGYFAPSQTASFKSPIPLQNKVLADATTNPEHASRFVEEWVQTTAETTCQPFEPAMQPLNEESHGVLDDAEAADGPIRASPAKRRHAKVRKRPKAECDADIEDGDDVSVHDPVEPQFMSSGEARSSQPTSYAHSLIQDPNGAKTEERLIDIRGEDSWAGAHQPANVINVQRSLTFVNPSPQIIPMGNSQKPASPGPRPATKLIRAPTAVRDLLTDEGPGIAYPVAVPAPAIKGPYMPPKSQKLASNVSDLPADGSVEGWLKSNPTMAASGVLKDNPLLIGDGENKASAGYAAAAKRGAARSRGAPRARGTTRGRIYKGVAPPNERLQSSSELQSRQVYRTMNQKMAKPNVGQTSQLEAFESATIQLLQSANTFRGMVNLEVDVGRVLVKAGKGAIGRTFLPSDWSSIFDGPTGNKPETVFINM